MYQRQSPLFTGAAGSAAFALSPSVTAPAAQGGEATPSVPPLPHTGKRRRRKCCKFVVEAKIYVR
jgi:hypothetical protein